VLRYCLSFCKAMIDLRCLLFFIHVLACLVPAGFPKKQLVAAAGQPAFMEVAGNMVFDYVQNLVRGNRLIITFSYLCNLDPHPLSPAAVDTAGSSGTVDADHAAPNADVVDEDSELDSESEDEEFQQAVAGAAALVGDV
jgi:hypothetical protein